MLQRDSRGGVRFLPYAARDTWSECRKLSVSRYGGNRGPLARESVGPGGPATWAGRSYPASLCARTAPSRCASPEYAQGRRLGTTSAEWPRGLYVLLITDASKGRASPEPGLGGHRQAACDRNARRHRLTSVQAELRALGAHAWPSRATWARRDSRTSSSSRPQRPGPATHGVGIPASGDRGAAVRSCGSFRFLRPAWPC